MDAPIKVIPFDDEPAPSTFLNGPLRGLKYSQEVTHTHNHLILGENLIFD
jgi:hypothetical protein